MKRFTLICLLTAACASVALMLNGCKKDENKDKFEGKITVELALKSAKPILNGTAEKLEVTVSSDATLDQDAEVKLDISPVGNSPANGIQIEEKSIIIAKGQKSVTLHVILNPNVKFNHDTDYTYKLALKDLKGNFAMGNQELTITVNLPRGKAQLGLMLKDPSKATLKKNENEQVTLVASLSYALTEDCTVNVTITPTGDPKLEGGIKAENATITIPKGEKMVEFSVMLDSKVAQSTDEDRTFTYDVALDGALPQNTEMDSEHKSVPLTLDIPKLSREERLLAAWKEKFNLDLTPFVGNIKVKVNLEYPKTDDGWGDPKNGAKKEYSGETTIVVSENATEDMPLLSMTSNAMGMRELMRTQLDTIIWSDRGLDVTNQYGSDVYKKVSPAINWNKTSQETFEVMLLDINMRDPNKHNSINFIRHNDVKDCNNVGFTYKYSAEDRFMANSTLYEENKSQDGCPEPALYLNHSTATSDSYGPGFFILPTATLKPETKELIFKFVYDTSYISADYTKVTVTYTGKMN